MTFADPRWLWALAALPPVAALEWRAVVRADRSLERLVGAERGSVLLSQRRSGQRRLSAALRMVALAVLALGAADPQLGRELVRRGATGSDLVLVLDASASMDARDVAPSRLDEARREALALLDRVEGSRVGVVAFAGEAVRLCPLTLDRGAARLSIEGVTSGPVSDPGTDLGKALKLGAKLMPSGRREEQAIVLWTDGEDLEHGASSAIDDLTRTGIRVFAVGVGTRQGDVVPVLDDQGRAVDVKRDESGGPVRSRLDEALLRSLTGRTHGAFFTASRPGGELPRLLAALSTVARSGRGERLVERPVSRFAACAALAALLLLLDRVRARRRVRIGEPRSGGEPGPAAGDRSERSRAAARKAARVSPGVAALGLALAWSVMPDLAHAQSAWAKADRAFRAGRWSEAETLYARRLERSRPRRAEVDLATVRGQLGKHERAEADLARLAAEDDVAGRAAGYNLGTLLGERHEYEDGLKELRRSLERDPGDRDARWNYEVLLRRRSEEQKKNQSPPRPQRSGGGSGQAQGTPPPSPGAQRPSPSPPSTSPPSSPPPPADTAPSSGFSGGMNRAQAEQLLNALEEQARLQHGQRRVRVLREKRGRDW
ncbi:MAG: VWA domain-containing protein [Candidatus Eisenbacteria bacterium]|nr:VWA domain-containing protein [Candidatus Eisenbacteria bacterium]